VSAWRKEDREKSRISGLSLAPASPSLTPRSSGIWQKRQAGTNGPDIWAVAGGKGGVGKSVIAANLALGVAQYGLRCLLVDADLGGGNQHTLFGERAPSEALEAFIAGEVKSLASVLKASRYPGLTLAFSRCDVSGAANPKHSQKQKLIRNLHKSDFDVVVLDLGAGTSFNTLDMFLAARVHLVVTTPEPTAVQNAYGFIKCAAQRARTREEPAPFTPRMLVNAAHEHEADYVFSALASVSSAFMQGREPGKAGWVRNDPAMKQAVLKGSPLLAHAKNSPSAQDLLAIATSLLDECFEPTTRVTDASSLARGMNEELRIGPRLLHIQTEDLGEAKGQIRTQVFESGRVVFSKEVAYGMKLADGRVLSRQQQVEYQHRVIAKALLDRRVG
jgi:MinD-like ATPase involved in chromosome partitioning or flagellar assembly